MGSAVQRVRALAQGPPHCAFGALGVRPAGRLLDIQQVALACWPRARSPEASPGCGPARGGRSGGPPRRRP
eukprot:9109342-Lingulodinium_polyedra.AAC.1